jgi:hypothetical protein
MGRAEFVNLGGKAPNPTVHYNKAMTRSARIVALLLAVATLAPPLGATICAGHCVQPQEQAAVALRSHCSSAMESQPVHKATGTAESPLVQLKSADDCGLKAVPVIVKPGDEQGRHLDAQLPALPQWLAAEERTTAGAACSDSSPPGPASPHLTPLRI